MTYLANSIFGLGVLGLMGMGPLFPFLARAFWTKRKSPPATTLPSLEILLPAHNEEKQLGKTLQSLGGGKHTAILVGLDACTDRTKEIAQASGARVLEFSFKSKWKTLNALVKESRAEWVALVDAGIIWPEDFISEIFKHDRESVVAIAPSYSARSGCLEKIHWQVERWLKTQESFSVGPVSVHGATVFYRRAQLITALSLLEREAWLNDDVAIPTALHIAFPEMNIVYVSQLKVIDEGIANSKTRRLRLVAGNLQWLRGIFPLLHSNPPAFLIAHRRVFRVFWAYWFGFLAMGGISISSYSLIFLAPLFLFPKAAYSSLFAALLLLEPRKEIPWK